MSLNIDNIKKPDGYVLVSFAALIACTFLFPGCGGGKSSNPKTDTSVAAVTAIVAVAGDSAITLSWSSVADATSYDIYRSILSTQKGSKIASVPSSTTSYTDTGATNGTTYYYVVDAIGSSGVIAVSSQVSATPAPVSGSVTISGTISYQDKEYDDQIGFTGNTSYKAARSAAVELISGSTSDVLSSTSTDANGAFSITASPAGTVYVRVNAEATLPPGANAQVAVKNLSGSIYAIASNNFTLSGSATVNISVPASSAAGGAFNMLDVFTAGMEFVHNLSGSYPSSPLYGYWETDTTGTYYCTSYDSTYCPQGKGIYVLNSTEDTDEYDDDVLYHEFGHFTAQHFSKDDSPGGVHYLTDNDLDLRLSWSEGWGDSVPGAIKLWLSSDPSRGNLLSSAAGVSYTEYIDTNSSGVGISIDMGDPDGAYGFNYSYAGSEVAIAKILLDVNKAFGMPHIWDVISSFTTTTATPANLELFWDSWIASKPTSSGVTSMDAIFQDRSIHYSLDSWDLDGGDNDISSAKTYTLGSPQVHTLYGIGDLDYVIFSATTGSHYTITTENLLNGADTKITLYDAVNALVTSNDDFGGLNSRVSFVAGSTDNYKVEIKSSSKRQDGRYGTYTLKLSSP